MAQHVTGLVKRRPRDAAEHRRPARRHSLARTIGRLLEEARSGDSDWTLPIVLGGILLFVATVVAVVLTIVELAALLA